jgi:transcriptional regulator GlxA family with amidase domain
VTPSSSWASLLGELIVRDVAFVMDSDQSSMALGLVMAFEIANSVCEDPPYGFHFVSETGGWVKTASGLMVDSEPFTQRPFDTLIVCGGVQPAPSTPGLLAFMREAPSRHRRIVAICTGSFVLAEAGLLDGRRATMHWRYAREFQTRFPNVKLDPDRIFTRDGPFWSTAGGAASLDLCLALIENDLGPELAKAVARTLVLYNRRCGGQSQISALLELAPKSDRIHTALAYARDNLHKPLTVSELAQVACISPRQFSRAFQAETGQSPAKAVESLRVERARALMEQSRHSIEVVARQTGFSDRDKMRRAFLRAFGQPPQVLRRTARAAAVAPGSRSETPDEAATLV